MARCERTEVCSFFQNKMSGLPSVVNMMKQSYCEQDKDRCARYKLKKMIFMGYTLPEEDSLQSDGTFAGSLVTLVENLYPSDQEKLKRIMSRLVL